MANRDQTLDKRAYSESATRLNQLWWRRNTPFRGARDTHSTACTRFF